VQVIRSEYKERYGVKEWMKVKVKKRLEN
jgi:hypothetical protein